MIVKADASIGSMIRITSHFNSPYYDKAKEWYFSQKGGHLHKLRHTILEELMGEVKNSEQFVD